MKAIFIAGMVVLCTACQPTPKEGLGNELSVWVSTLYNDATPSGFRSPSDKEIVLLYNEKLGEDDLLQAFNRQVRKVSDSPLALDSIAKVRQYYEKDEQIQRYNYNPFFANVAHYEDFWHDVKPVVGPIFQSALDELALPLNPLNSWPVLHFRCSDGPFNKHKDYTFPKYSYYLKVIDHMRTNVPQASSQWYLITGCGWGIAEENKAVWCDACKHYIADLRDFLNEKEGIEMTVIDSQPVLEDWASMFKAPVLIASIPSSLSFMAGAVSPGAFYSPAYMSQAESGLKIYQPANKYPADIYFVEQKPEDIILHKNTDWTNYREVIKVLRGQ